MVAYEQDITIRLDEPYGPEILGIVTPTGGPADLTGVLLTIKFREINGQSDLLSVPLTVVSPPTAGKASLSISAEDTAALATIVNRVCRFKVTDSSNVPVMTGRVYVAPGWGAV